MYRYILTTALLCAVAGTANAQISFGGETRFGVQHDAGAVTQTFLSSRTRLNVTMSGTTDGGLTFGAFTRFQTTNTGTGVASGARSFIAANGFRLEVGNADGAIARRVNIDAGSMGFTDTGPGGGGWRPATHAGYATFSSGGAGPNLVRLDADFGAFGVSISARSAVGNAAEAAVSYRAQGLRLGLGGHENGNATLSAEYAANDLAAGAVVSRTGVDTNWRLWGSYAFGANTARLIYSSVGGANAWGAGLTHDLGGGARLQAAVGQNLAGNTVAELGVNLRF